MRGDWITGRWKRCANALLSPSKGRQVQEGESAEAIARVIDYPERRKELGMRNYLAAQGLPIADVADWYLLHFQQILNKRHPVPAPITKPGVIQ